MTDHKVFSHLSGIIIVSHNPRMSDELGANANWLEYRTYTPPRVFFSHDLVKIIQDQGLPLSVKKFLCNRAI